MLNVRKSLYSLLSILIITIVSLSQWGSLRGRAQDGSQPIDEVRSLREQDTGIAEPLGLVFSSRLNAFYVIDGSQWKKSPAVADFVQLTATEERRGLVRLAAALQDPLNMAFDDQANRLLVLLPRSGQLLQLPADEAGNILPKNLQRLNVRRFGVRQPQGMAVDPATGTLYILDASGPQFIRIVPDASGSLAQGAVSVVSLGQSGITAPRGIAFDPTTGHLQILSPGQKTLYELTSGGQVTGSRDLSAFNVQNPQAMVFAPSADLTDDPSATSLFLADSGTADTSGSIIEFSLAAPASLPGGTTLLAASLVRIIDTSKAAWSPSAPDPAGLDYFPPLNRLLVVDSEVDEMKVYFTGKNAYLSTTAGALTGTCSTISYTHEPTGVAYNTDNTHIFISDDAPKDKVFELNLGPDNTYCTGDDTVTTTLVNALYGAADAEDVGYGANKLFIAGGADAEVFVIPLGANGVLGGGDDGPMTHFDTAHLGFNDLEGITYNPANGTLYIVSTKGTDRYLGEVTLSGTLLRAYDLSFMGSAGNIRSDVAIAPASQNPAIQNIYIASRGVDNNSNRNENDGRIWEISLSGGSGGGSPTPSHTPTLTSTPTLTHTPTLTQTPGPSPTSTLTPTPTNTPEVSDLIFADGFESGSFSAWTANKTDSGDLSVTTAAALQGGQGMSAVIDDSNTIFVTDDTPNGEPRYRARFYLDPNSISMASGNRFFLFNAFMGTSTAVMRVEMQFASGQYQLRANVLNNSGTWTSTAWFPISDAPHPVEIDWRAASSGSSNGGVTLWIDGVQAADIATIANDTHRIDRARLGAIAGMDAGTLGTLFFDAFESHRLNYIGP